MKSAESEFFSLIDCVVRGNLAEVEHLLDANPSLAVTRAQTGAERLKAPESFLVEIRHYIYAGDSALHMAAAAFRKDIATILIKHGAECRAKNRRGATPLHYAADANNWQPFAQAETIAYLLSAGCDPNALDKSGVAPLHRAVRTRSFPAVKALIEGGANAHLTNKSGSTPLKLASMRTGRSGSGSDLAREQQAEIIKFLNTFEN